MKQKPDIIIIDDDPVVTSTIEFYLEEFGLIIETYTDPKLALDAVILHKPRIVFVDLNMPALRGDQLIVKLSEKFIFQTTSVFLITGEMLNSIDRMKIMTLGFEHIISKPFDEKDISSAVESVFSLHQLKQKSA